MEIEMKTDNKTIIIITLLENSLIKFWYWDSGKWKLIIGYMIYPYVNDEI